MSYNVALQCGCVVYVSCHPDTGLAHTRVLERRGGDCSIRAHEIGLHVQAADVADLPCAVAPPVEDTATRALTGGQAVGSLSGTAETMRRADPPPAARRPVR